jgi:hypothetical protein
MPLLDSFVRESIRCTNSDASGCWQSFWMIVHAALADLGSYRPTESADTIRVLGWTRSRRGGLGMYPATSDDAR